MKCNILTTPTCVTPTWLCGGIASLYVCSSVSVSSHLCLTLHCYIVSHCVRLMYTDPLSSYPSAELLSKLQVAQWRELGAHLGLSEDQLEDAEKSPQPTAAVLLAAKVRDINLKWNQIAESLLRVGGYDLAESICNKYGKLALWCLNSSMCVAAPLIEPEPVRLALGDRYIPAGR